MTSNVTKYDVTFATKGDSTPPVVMPLASVLKWYDGHKHATSGSNGKHHKNDQQEVY